ncbi:cingulin isoform X4 [Nerophis ophidion]|uniref:cingulin isoform X4 n=1 Tax=Nerophis ophidion TaxID=159077 RepID=UPI002ADF0A5C|nr:cingulin isoform X4 [Nerophis ophidion]
MSTLSTDRKPLVDYGVQIRFIKDLQDTGGASPDKSRGNNNNHTATAHPGSKYGVAVRVQGISGQPYVVLNNSAKGDSYGVQLNTPTASAAPQSPYKSAPKSNEAEEVVNASHSPVSPTEDEEVYRSPLRRPPGDGQAGGQGEDEGRTVKEGRSKAEPQVKAAASEVQTKQESTSKEEYNEAGLKPVKVNGAGPRGFKQNGFIGTQQGADSAAQSISRPSASTDEKPIDTNSLAPINKLIRKFNNKTPGSGPQARGRTGARHHLRLDERKRSRSLDARKENPLPSPPSPTFNPYASTSSNLSSRAGLGRDAAPVVNKAAAPESLKQSLTSSGMTSKEAAPVIARKPEIPPRSLSQKANTGDEAQVKQAIYSILKVGTTESDSSLKRKTDLVYETTSNLKRAGPDGKQIQLTLAELEEQLGQCKNQLQRAHEEQAEERITREMCESRMRLQEDQLAELQEELRRVSERAPPSDSLRTDLVTLQADLAEAAMLRHHQDEILRQRDRELTALKGALKEEVECHDREMDTLREQYSVDMHNLRKTMEQVTQSQEEIEEERERVNASLLTLEEELDSCRDQGEQWKSQLETTSQELHLTKDKLLQCHQEKEELESNLKEVQESLLAVHKQQMPASSVEELQRCHDDLHRARLDADQHKDALDKKSEALDAVRKASGEREAELLSEIGKLKEQKAELEKTLDKAKEAPLSAGRTAVDHSSNVELQEANSRLRERLARMRQHSSMTRSPEAEEAIEALEDENRALKSQLEEVKRSASRLGKEKDEMSRRLEERDLEREALRRGKTELEEQKRLLDRALEKITKEMETMMGESRQSVVVLQTQLDDYRERSRKDLLEAQRNNKDKLAELQRAQSNCKTQQEEVSRLKKELLTCSEERDSAQLERDLLNNRLKHLEGELESEKGSQTDRTREIRGLEDKIKTLEIELDEEKSSVELLNDRITRSRDQVDQLRSELMQERSARHDLEMDKSAIDRQVKELRSRLADMEGQTRPTAGIAILESKILELEERLRSEEREKSGIQASHRRTERKLKELNATLDQERSQHVEQKDQLTLRVKALKRQVDESEGEVERLEGVRRKVLRELEEQQELQEAMQAKVSALESELKRWRESAPSSSSAPSYLLTCPGPKIQLWSSGRPSGDFIS